MYKLFMIFALVVSVLACVNQETAVETKSISVPYEGFSCKPTSTDKAFFSEPKCLSEFDSRDYLYFVGTWVVRNEYLNVKDHDALFEECIHEALKSVNSADEHFRWMLGSYFIRGDDTMDMQMQIGQNILKRVGPNASRTLLGCCPMNDVTGSCDMNAPAYQCICRTSIHIPGGWGTIGDLAD